MTWKSTVSTSNWVVMEHTNRYHLDSQCEPDGVDEKKTLSVSIFRNFCPDSKSALVWITRESYIHKFLYSSQLNDKTPCPYRDSFRFKYEPDGFEYLLTNVPRTWIFLTLFGHELSTEPDVGPSFFLSTNIVMYLVTTRWKTFLLT